MDALCALYPSLTVDHTIIQKVPFVFTFKGMLDIDLNISGRSLPGQNKDKLNESYRHLLWRFRLCGVGP